MAAEVPGIAISIRLPPLPGLHSHEVATEFRNRASRVRLECDGRYDIEGDYHGEWEACRILRTAPPEDPWDSTCCRCDVECAADGTIVRGVHPDLLRARRSTGVPRGGHVKLHGLKPQDTVLSIKRRLAQGEASKWLSISMLVDSALHQSRMELDDDATLVHAGVRDGAALHLVLHPAPRTIGRSVLKSSAVGWPMEAQLRGQWRAVRIVRRHADGTTDVCMDKDVHVRGGQPFYSLRWKRIPAVRLRAAKRTRAPRTSPSSRPPSSPPPHQVHGLRAWRAWRAR